MSTSSASGFMSKKVITAIIAVVVVVILAFSLFGTVNKLRNEGIAKETGLNAQYLSAQNQLSTFTNKVVETLGIADKSANKAKEIITSAIKGRYEGTAQNPGTDGTMFSAISEAYPDIKENSAAYAKAIDLVDAGREAFKNEQNKLIDQIRSYDTWKASGLIQSTMINALGFPSKTLEARVGTNVIHGADALDKMKTLILNSSTITSYETGVTDPLITPESSK